MIEYTDEPPDLDVEDNRTLTQEDLNRSLADFGELFGEPKYSPEEELDSVRTEFAAACERLRGRAPDLLITHTELNDAFLRHRAKRLLGWAVRHIVPMRQLDGHAVFVRMGREWIRAASSDELPVGLAVLRWILRGQSGASARTVEIFSELTVELLDRGRAERDAAILVEGLRLAGYAAQVALPMSAMVAVAQRLRADCAHELYLLTQDTGRLTEALIAARAAVDASPHRVGDAWTASGPTLTRTEDPGPATGRVRADHLALLARCLLDRRALTGDEEDGHAAVTALREALHIAPADDPNGPAYQVALAGALADDDPAGLDEAIELATVGRAADGGAELGRLLELRFRRDGGLTALHDAVAALEPGEGVERDARLAHVLTTLYEQVRDSRLLERAITLHRTAVAATPDTERAKPQRLAACAEALVLHAERHADPSALREAIDCYREALRRPLPSHRELVSLRTGLALTLHRLGVAVADAQAARDEAQLLAKTVIAEFPPAHPGRAAALAPLGPVLAARVTSRARTSGPELDRVVTVAREHLDELPEPDPTRPLRLLELGVALRERFDRAAAPGDRSNASDAFARAARSAVLPAVTRCLAAREWASLEASAGDWTSAAQAYRLAVQLLPGVAVRELRRDDQEFHLTSFARLASDAAMAVLRAGGTGQEAVDLLEQGRGILLNQAIDSDPDAGQAARPVGPVIAVNGSVHGCAALVVRPDGVTHVPLPDLTAQEIADRAEAFTVAVEVAAHGTHDPEHQVAANRFVTRTLNWLWDVVAEPVLAECVEDRVWWLPTGALSFLPLHAAGYHDDGSRRTVLDRAVSSYTPTLRMLRRSQTRASHVALPVDPLVVSMPETPGAAPLPGVTAETEELLRVRPGARVLHGPRASRKDALAALATGGWAHFACHAVSDPAEPSASHLVLADGPVSVLDIVRMHIEDAQLAYLSACSTARGGTQLADEAIHIGSAFQLAGYPHVVATLWPIADQAAATIAAAVYQNLPDGPASALHAATRQLRDACAGRSPLLWASHIHLGA